MKLDATEIEGLLPYCTPEERAFINTVLSRDRAIWRPLPGPQTMAYESKADVVGYGGAAGGGKTDLAIGKMLTQSKQAAVFRREGTEMAGIIDRMKELIGHDVGYVGSGRWWGWRNPVPGVQIEFGSVPNPGDETKHQGRPKDLLVLDEAANFLESQARFLMGWVRTTDRKQRTQTLMCFNPPTTVEGRWIIDFFGPWLDKKHPNPAKPGELRWFAMVDGKEIECASAPFRHNNEWVTPKSRTFIPARIADNPYLMGTNYMATLQAFPEPLRSQMLYGDFYAGVQDDPFQVCPTAWVEAAQARWAPKTKKARMASMGVDVARGGADNTILARRHEDMWFDELLVYPGKDTPDGPTVAGIVIANTRDRATVHVDVIGVGSSPYDFLKNANQPVIGVNVAEAARGFDKSGRLGFVNQRSELWWRMREALDPANNTGIALPPDKRLLADLCTPKWSPQGARIVVQSRDEIMDKLKRSPDFGSAVVLALMDTPRLDLGVGALTPKIDEYNPLDHI